MNFVEKKEVKGTDARQQLKEANQAYTDCISKEFLSKFLQGDNVRVEDFCVQERTAMATLDRQIYGKLQF